MSPRSYVTSRSFSGESKTAEIEPNSAKASFLDSFALFITARGTDGDTSVQRLTLSIIMLFGMAYVKSVLIISRLVSKCGNKCFTQQSEVLDSPLQKGLLTRDLSSTALHSLNLLNLLI